MHTSVHARVPACARTRERGTCAHGCLGARMRLHGCADARVYVPVQSCEDMRVRGCGAAGCAGA
eukprot:13257267-Alexandrium_andersonii.AAC.1